MNVAGAPPSPRQGLGLARTAARLAVKSAGASLAGYVTTSLAAGCAPVAAAWLTKLVLDRLTGGVDAAALMPAVVALAVVGLAVAVLPHLSGYFSAELSRRLTLDTRSRLYSAVSRLPGLARLEDPPFYDRLMLAQQAGSDGPARMVTGVLGVGQSAVTIGGFLVTLAAVAPAMAGVVVAATVPALLAERALNRRRARLAYRLGASERREMFYAHLLRDLKAAKEIRLFGIGSYLHGKMLGELGTINAARRRLDRRALSVQGGLALLAAAVAGLGLLWVSRSAASGELSIGDVAMFMAAFAGAQGSLSAVVRGLSAVHEAVLAFDHYQAVVTAEPDLDLAARTTAVAPLRRGIELRDVWFRYTPDQPWILRGVNLDIPRGKAVALVGHNGAGKSTLVKILCRLYEPTRGAVLWDGIDLREFDPAELRDRLSVVFQDYMCYDLTARENIGIGDLAAMASPGRMQRAARRAGVHDTIAGLPRGYDTLLSRMFPEAEGDAASGLLLSGGQWQRLAVARALIREGRDLLILDEPSAGLDAEAEHELHQTLSLFRQESTSLLISHRLGAIRQADAIAVLVNGEIGELGTHAQLMAGGRAYSRLFTLQARGYQSR